MTIKEAIVDPFLQSADGIKLKKSIKAYDKETFPSNDRIFRATYMEASEVRLFVIGAEPYRDGSADGLALSSFTDWNDMHPLTKAMLTAIRNQLYSYMGDATFKGAFPTGNLNNWMQNGALLLNSVLTSAKDNPGVFGSVGWQQLTGQIVKHVLAAPQAKAVVAVGKVASSLLSSHLVSGNHRIWNLPGSPEEMEKDGSTFLEIHEYLKESYEHAPFWKHEHKDYSYCVDIKVPELVSMVKKDVLEAQVPLPNAKHALKNLEEEALETLRLLQLSTRANMDYVFDFRTKL